MLLSTFDKMNDEKKKAYMTKAEKFLEGIGLEIE